VQKSKDFWLTKMELSQKKVLFSDPAGRDNSVSNFILLVAVRPHYE
jgi:hypothetical protein